MIELSSSHYRDKFKKRRVIVFLMSFGVLLKSTDGVDVIETIFDEGFFRMKKVRLKNLNEFEYCEGSCMEKVITVFGGICNIHLEPDNRDFILGEKDICYVPVSKKTVITKSFGEPLMIIVEGETSFKTLPYVKRFVETRGVLRGETGFRRVVYTMLDEKDPAGKLIVGFTEGYKGEWTSYPHHKHDDELEAYLYYGMGDYYGIQLIESNNRIESYVVRDWDVVLIRRGYHPNVALPKCGINYLWVVYPLGERRLRPEIHPKYL